MPTPTPTPSPTDKLYLETINQQRDYLAKLQEAFNKHCDEITSQANEKLDAIPDADKEGKAKVLAEQKQQLDQALVQFKSEVTHSMGVTRKKLEEIQSQRENNLISDLEEKMKQL